VPSNLVFQLAVDFVKLSSYFFFLITVLIIWGIWKVEICHLVRGHSMNLFGYRDVTSGPVCVPAY